MENRIKELRKGKGLEQKELAGLAGISHWWMNHVENGTKKPSIRTLIKIADALGVEVEELGVKMKDFF